jgi:phospholipid/cholesterol/gamma-HCH transport system ATP-binding protein
MIVFDGVTFSYGTREILKDLHFSIAADERVAVLGGSGEGKTTILKLVLGLIRPDAGKIFVDGQNIVEKTEEALRDVRMKFSIVFQEGALFDSLNVKENVAFCLREYTDMSEEEIDLKVRELLRRVGVEQAVEFMPEELSGGMHRRVAIARSLAAFDPTMFLYDEPTSGLDPVNADNICKLIIDLSRDGRGFIIVTHKVFDALKVANRFIFLQGGEMLLDGDRDRLLHSSIPDIRIFISELQHKEEGKNV